MKLQVGIALIGCLMLEPAYSQSTCINFPPGFIPFSSISYVTAANSAGDHLVVGAPAPGALSAIVANISLPAFTNQTFCDSQVQLAPQQYFPSVYVPTALEQEGNFSAFAGLLVDPVTNQPYQNGIIPISQLNKVFAWRIGAAQAGSASRGWVPTGSMTDRRGVGEAAVMLPSGKVLIVGGNSDTRADLYDPATGRFTAAGNTVVVHGGDLTGTLLNDGRVLIVGGESSPAVAELYDPVSGMFTLTGTPVYPHGFYGTSTLLKDGRVLVVGGLASPGDIGTVNAGAETYDPKTGKFTKVGAMSLNRANHTATLLLDGRVLIAGGSPANTGSGVPGYDSAEIFNPTSGNFSFTGTMQQPRGNHFAVQLADGRVLLGGGYGSQASGQSAELFQPASGTFGYAGEMTTPRGLSAAILLPSGQALIVGGYPNFPTGTNAVEVYDANGGAFTTTGYMAFARGNVTTTLLLDGRVLATGGEIVCCDPGLASAEIYTPTIEGLISSQSGLTFRGAQGNTSLSPQTVAVLSATDTIPWTVSTHTYEGGNWLTVSLASGNSIPGAIPTSLTISVNAAGLAAQDYYGVVTLTPTDGKHPPVSITIVLNIVPAGTAAPPGIAPSGLVFLASGASIAPQSFVISNLTSSALNFTATGSAAPSWFDFSPKSGTVGAAKTTTIAVTPSVGTLTNGVYRGSVKIAFGDGSSQSVDLLLVISGIPAGSSAGPVPAAAAPACAPTKLLPVFTTIGTGFSAPAAWPTSIIVQVVDDCGSAVNAGTVIVSFSDGDPPIALLATGNGTWAGTWVPQHNAAGFTARADAQELPLTGSVSVSGQVSLNPTVPVVSTGGVVSAGDFTSAPALGLLVSIFGSALADSPVSGGLPLAVQLGTTIVTLGTAVLPLVYVSDGLINVVIPYDVPVNTATQLVVQRGSAISVPVKTAVFNASPAVLSTAGSGSGQGHIYLANAQGGATLADQNSPAKAGDTVVIYCIGLGAVSPSVTGGAISPSSPPASATARVTVTFGAQTATAAFAGLTPGLAGLYQINVTVPTGVTPGNQVPVAISAGGVSSSNAIFMAIQ